MNLHIIKFSFIILGVANAQEHKYTEVQLKGSCPKITYITNPDLNRSVGWWYRVYSNFNNSLCLNNEGQTKYVAQYDETTLNGQICCRSAANPKVPFCGKKIGSGTFSSVLENPGAFTYTFDGNTSTVYALETDYVNFIIIYGCKSGSGSDRDEMIFVYSRNYSLNDALQTRVRTIIRKNKIDWSKAKPVKHGPFTPYTPGPRPCT